MRVFEITLKVKWGYPLIVIMADFFVIENGEAAFYLGDPSEKNPPIAYFYGVTSVRPKEAPPLAEALQRAIDAEATLGRLQKALRDAIDEKEMAEKSLDEYMRKGAQ